MNHKLVHNLGLRIRVHVVTASLSSLKHCNLEFKILDNYRVNLVSASLYIDSLCDHSSIYRNIPSSLMEKHQARYVTMLPWMLTTTSDIRAGLVRASL